MTEKIRVYGIVQGVGFRPAVARYAALCGVGGYVCNRGSFVEILARGGKTRVEAFIRKVLTEPPRRAMILKWDVVEKTEEDEADAAPSSFEIRESSHEGSEIFVSPDIAICPDCKRELYDRQNRRYHHPYINCTQCGPRLTILDAVPYDRERTSMKMFPMCKKCAAEYHDPASRRYDAQPVCCNECGPEVYIAGHEEIRRDAAIRRTRSVIAGGGIAAVKGIGGFHICCDAGNAAAVERLRALKARPAKPFAVMMRDMDTVQRECLADRKAKELLTGWQKPILLLPKKEGGRVCGSAAPDNEKLGVFLPYAPVQCLLFDNDDGIAMPDVLIMTSGNTSGAPICRDDAEAKEELGEVVDIILSGTRPILTRCDDSVMELYQDLPYMIRRSRGYAPLPFFAEKVLAGGGAHCVLAIGGELKNTFCIGKGRLLYPSSYIGDLSDERSGQVLKETVERFLRLFEAAPECIVADLHPGYVSTAIAGELARTHGIPLVKVQHHYAHILSCIAENDYAGKVIGVSYDGTGYGTDGTIWGGEILICDADGFTRAGSIMPFTHAGGDSASREGWRIAASMLDDLYEEGEAAAAAEATGCCSRAELSLIRAMKRAGINCTASTSCGRLFDAVSAILGIRKRSTYEGEASTALMQAAGASRQQEGRVWQQESFRYEDGRYLLRTDLLVREITERARRSALQEEEEPGGAGTGRGGEKEAEEGAQGKKREEMSVRNAAALYFHAALADMTADLVIRLAGETGIRTAALSGGCFQNLLLLDLLRKRLEAAGIRVLIHRLSPPNDGGIALGQALYGERMRMKEAGEQQETDA